MYKKLNLSLSLALLGCGRVILKTISCGLSILKLLLLLYPQIVCLIWLNGTQTYVIIQFSPHSIKLLHIMSFHIPLHIASIYFWPEVNCLRQLDQRFSGCQIPDSQIQRYFLKYQLCTSSAGFLSSYSSNNCPM